MYDDKSLSNIRYNMCTVHIENVLIFIMKKLNLNQSHVIMQAIMTESSRIDTNICLNGWQKYIRQLKNQTDLAEEKEIYTQLNINYVNNSIWNRIGSSNSL